VSNNGLNIIYTAIDQLNEQSDDGEKIVKDPDTRLFGGDGGIDSLDLVNLVVAIEHHIEDTTGNTVVLVDEQTMAMENNPFHSVATLSTYLENLLETS
jgi:acyl carrier protein